MKFVIRPLATIAILIIAVYANDYLLENVLFIGNEFNWISGLFSTVEIVFLSYCIAMVLGLKGLVTFIRSLVSKSDKEVKFVEPTSVRWPIILASLLYGVFSGIILFFPVKGFSFLECLASGTALSMAWGLVYLFFWKRGDLLWLLDWLYTDEDQASFEEEEEEEKDKSKLQ